MAVCVVHPEPDGRWRYRVEDDDRTEVYEATYATAEEADEAAAHLPMALRIDSEPQLGRRDRPPSTPRNV